MLACFQKTRTSTYTYQSKKNKTTPRAHRVPDEEEAAVEEAPILDGGPVHDGALQDGRGGRGLDEGEDFGEVGVFL